MKKINYVILLLSVSLVFTGCINNRVANESTDVNGGNGVDLNAETTGPMRDFFLPEGSKAHYTGQGNEFAELKIEVAQPYEDYFIVYENNGEAFVRKTYKLGNDKIEILEETTVNYEESFPTLEEVKAMKPIGIYLQKPFSEGTVFDDWTIMKTEVTVETPYKTFDNAFVIETEGPDAVIRKYFVEGYGEVKRESVMTTGHGEELIVTSTLKSVDK